MESRIIFPADWQTVGCQPEILVQYDPSDGELEVKILTLESFQNDGWQAGKVVTEIQPELTNTQNLLTAQTRKSLSEGKYVICLVSKAIRDHASFSGIIIDRVIDYWNSQFTSAIKQRYERLPEKDNNWLFNSECPFFSITTTCYNTPEKFLIELADTITNQRFANFEWILLDNGSTDENTIKSLKEIAVSDSRIKLLEVEKNLHIIGGNRYCLEQAQGQYIIPIDSDDLLYLDSLAVIYSYCQKHNKPDLLYSDEQKISSTGKPAELIWRKKWSKLFSYSTCPASHLMIFNRKVALEADLYTGEYARGSHDWDTFLRLIDRDRGVVPVHIPNVLYGWRMHPQSSAMSEDSKNYLVSSQLQVVEESIKRKNLDLHFRVEGIPHLPLGFYNIWRQPIEPKSVAVDLILENDNFQSLLNLEKNLQYLNYPSIYLRFLYNKAFFSQDFTHKILQLFKKCQVFPSSCLGFISQKDLAEKISLNFNDNYCRAIVNCNLQLTNHNWLWDAVGTLELDNDTGIVGGTILSPEEKIIHIGYVVGLDGFFETPKKSHFLHEAYFRSPYLGVRRNVSAIHSGLIIVGNNIFNRVGLMEGIDSEELGIFGIDFCLRSSELGIKTAYSPQIEAIYNNPVMPSQEALSLKSKLIAKYQNKINHDPYYSEYLVKSSQNYGQVKQPDNFLSVG